jgi:hypothetical protein
LYTRYEPLVFAIAPASNVRPSARATGTAIVDSPAHSISAVTYATKRRLSAASVDTVAPSEKVQERRQL